MKITMIKKIFYVSLFFIFYLNIYAIEPIYLNVHIVGAKIPAEIKINGQYSIYNYKYKSEIAKGENSVVNVENNPKGIKLPGYGTYKNGIIIETEDGFFLDGKEYYGNVVIINYENKNIVINNVSVEDYTKGVLPYEMSPSWDIEALKAQAAAARSYALFHYALNKESKRPFDVDNTTKYQVYSGKGKVNDNVKEAVESTKNQVITFKKKVIPAYFHSICGGATDSALNEFGMDIPYLRGTKCKYCKDKIEVWINQVSQSNINKIFKFNKDEKVKIKISSFTRTKKVSELVLSSSEKSLTITGREFRNSLGVSTVPSLSFSIKPNEDGLSITGQGKGHGVGMCQWGAYGMANKNIPYKKIISFYYKMTTLVDYTKLKEITADVWLIK